MFYKYLFLYCKYIIPLIICIVNTHNEHSKHFFVFTIQSNYATIQIKVVFILTLGERLKKARKSKGFTQDKLAETIGTSRGVITNLEHDKTETPQPLIINAICTTVEITQEWLINGIGKMDNSEAIKSSKVLSEIYSISKDLSISEQLYILDVIKTYKNHFNPKENE